MHLVSTKHICKQRAELHVCGMDWQNWICQAQLRGVVQLWSGCVNNELQLRGVDPLCADLWNGSSLLSRSTSEKSQAYECYTATCSVQLATMSIRIPVFTTRYKTIMLPSANSLILFTMFIYNFWTVITGKPLLSAAVAAVCHFCSH